MTLITSRASCDAKKSEKNSGRNPKNETMKVAAAMKEAQIEWIAVFEAECPTSCDPAP